MSQTAHRIRPLMRFCSSMKRDSAKRSVTLTLSVRNGPFMSAMLPLRPKLNSSCKPLATWVLTHRFPFRPITPPGKQKRETVRERTNGAAFTLLQRMVSALRGRNSSADWSLAHDGSGAPPHRGTSGSGCRSKSKALNPKGPGGLVPQFSFSPLSPTLSISSIAPLSFIEIALSR